ncbi:hypothetical protein CEXT_159731 [Caerostris extrusa]|uniref:Uncharacterized protein n=1 Tax=Caerostris extrusa TaxID=172846 RepID=A0AAV4NCR3_CAEEX|nr:hypothetical protein CEXT_159731 [Caerostris extrusa]
MITMEYKSNIGLRCFVDLADKSIPEAQASANPNKIPISFWNPIFTLRDKILQINAKLVEFFVSDLSFWPCQRLPWRKYRKYQFPAGMLSEPIVNRSPPIQFCSAFCEDRKRHNRGREISIPDIPKQFSGIKTQPISHLDVEGTNAFISSSVWGRAIMVPAHQQRWPLSLSTSMAKALFPE